MDICIICLRSDRRIQLNPELLQFHNEMCCFTIPFTSPSYCIECEYLLIKFYKFKQKCLKAAEVFQDWMLGKIKDSTHSLHNCLPPSSLGVWQHNPKRISIIELGLKSTAQPDVEELKNSLDEYNSDSNDSFDDEVISIKQVKIEIDQSGDGNDEVLSKLDHIDMEIKSDNGSEGHRTENSEHVQNDESQEFSDFDGKDKDSEEDEPKSTKRKRVSIKKEFEEVLKKGKVTIDKVKPFRRKIIMDDRFKEELMTKLSSYGDIETENGTVVDANLITKFMQHKGGMSVIKRLWKATNLEDIQELLPKIQSLLRARNKTNRDRYDKPEYKEVFDIEYLTTPEEKLAEFERRKTYLCYINAEHKCEICYQVFKAAANLKIHMETYHDETLGGQFCPICKMRYLETRRRRKRIKHAETHLAVFKCKLCPLVTYQRGTMKEHTEKHQGKIYHCKSCNMSYKCSSGYYRHMSVSHRRGRIVCAHCGRGFPSVKSLQVHTTVAHRLAPSNFDESTGVKCEECDVTLHSQSAYEAHLLDVHDPAPNPQRGSRPWPHPLRDDQPRPKRQYKYRKEKCRACNVSRAGFGWLKAHFKWEHPDLNMDALYADKKHHLCDICGIGTNSLVLLRSHMRTHTGDCPYACELCPKKFRSLMLLRNHQLHHFPPRLPCPQCGKKFKTKSNLYNHMKGHSGNRSYKCYICSKGFLHSAALNEHVRGVHYNIRRVRRRTQEGADGKIAFDRAKRGDNRSKRNTEDDFSSDDSGAKNDNQIDDIPAIESFNSL